MVSASRQALAAPSGWAYWVSWLIWLMPLLALALLAMVVQAAAREYYRRPDRPKHIWHITLPPTS
jgi:hypothetical protein